MKILIVLIFVSSLFFHGGIAATTDYQTDQSEVEALNAILIENWKIPFKGNNTVRFYNSTVGDYKNETKYWDINATNPCTGFIVDDSEDQRVYNISSSEGKLDILCYCAKNNSSTCNIIRLSAWNLNISGTIPVEIEKLKKLVFLNLDSNSLSGQLPAILGTLSEMKIMYLSYNNFSGPLPSQIGNLENIQTLSLWSNNFNGSLPPEIGNLKNIQTLYLFDNNFGGKVPDTLWNLTNLTGLDLSNNNFSGTFPSQIENLENIQTLSLSNNNFNGSLPSEIGNLENIGLLELSHNNFGGKVPDTLWNLTKLEYLSLSRNYFEGTIPTNIDNLVNLTHLYLSNNNFNGQLPSEIGNLKNIGLLDLSNNNFSGQLPSEIGNLKNIWLLDLSNNNFSGRLPSQIGNLENLYYLYLSYNSFEGTIPTNIGNLVNLTELDLSTNNFSGTFPSQIENLENLYYLSLSNIKFGGKIPKNLWNLKMLERLYLRNCSLEDFLPNKSIEIHTPLRNLDLGFNKLVGGLRNTIFNIPTLESLYLNNNDFNGGLPDKKSDNLMTIDLSNNNLEGYIDPKWNGMALNLVNNKFLSKETKKIKPRGLDCLQQTSNCFKGENLFTSFAINCGGEKMESADGKTIFAADNNNKTNTYFYVADKYKWAVTFSDRHDLNNLKKDITGVQDPELYQSATTSTKTLKYYGLGLKAGNYYVDLMFPNYIDADDGYRYIFDIYIQGIPEEKDCEILKESVFKKTYKVLVTNDTKNLEISFNPKINSKYFESSAVLISAIKVTPNFPVENGSTKKSTIVGVSVGVSFFILSCIVGYYLWKRQRKYYYSIDEGNIELIGLEVNTYRFLELNAATENFKPSNKLGEGGFGVVYKGTLYNGDIVAVKKLLVESNQGNEQFIAEVITISEVRQRNLVKLHGCCCHGNERMLVYEYMENGSLDTALYGRTGQLELDWDIRFTICLGIAKGLNYLHQYSTHRIIHRDIKSSNILLDQYLNPKISDFGLAKLFEDEMTHITTRAAGTYGYLAPEYALSGHLTEKVDVFAFGVVALEIISGKCCVDYSFVSFGSNQSYIIQWAWNIHENMDDDLAMVDPKLKSFNKEEVCRIIQVALLCTQMDSMSRPSMSHVIAMLNGEKDIGTLPSKPSYLMFWDVGNSSRAVDDIEFQPGQFDSHQQISFCSYFQSMPLQHAHSGSPKQKDEDYTKTI